MFCDASLTIKNVMSLLDKYFLSFPIFSKHLLGLETHFVEVNLFLCGKVGDLTRAAFTTYSITTILFLRSWARNWGASGVEKVLKKVMAYLTIWAYFSPILFFQLSHASEWRLRRWDYPFTLQNAKSFRNCGITSLQHKSLIDQFQKEPDTGNWCQNECI